MLSAIRRALGRSCYDQHLLEVMEYAVLPAGKLFRPRLVEALAFDLNKSVSSDHEHLAAAIELHHAYTLVHDDLPAMDNDLIRRGKPSTHARYGEWKAILTGDALLIASFEEVMRIRNKNAPSIHRLMTWATGAKGLVNGQFRDLSSSGKLTIQEVVRIHELKTARLIQVATLGAYLLSEKQSLQDTVQYLRLGREIGVSFQLLDDLSELAEANISDHEKNINPFITSFPEALRELKASHTRLKQIIQGLPKLKKMLGEYFEGNQQNLLRHMNFLEKNIEADLSELRSWITSLA